MSEVLNIDPGKGFVAIPAQVLELEISPGAFRVLIYLCNLANEAGWCWPSLEQIGENVGRSKAAISGYIQELRDTAVIESISQKMASGYNYRLKLRVLFWAEWVKTRSRKSINVVQSSERGVQSADRPASQKNNNYKKHSTPAMPSSEVVKSVYESWKTLTSGMPFGQYRNQPDQSLIQTTQCLLKQSQPSDAMSVTAVTSQLQELWKELSVATVALDLSGQARTCIRLNMSPKAIATLFDGIKQTWKPYWNNPPTPAQFEEMVLSAKAKHPDDSMLRIIAFDYKKWMDRNEGRKGFDVAA